MGAEASGLEQASGDVVGQVAEPECAAPEVLEPSVERFGRPVGCTGPVEVGQYVGGAFVQRPPQLGDLDEGLRNAAADVGDQLGHQSPATSPVLITIGGDHPLVDAPGRLDLDVDIVNEQRPQPVSLLSGEKVRAGVQSPARFVERIASEPAVAVDSELDPAPALVQCIAAYNRLPRTTSSLEGGPNKALKDLFRLHRELPPSTHAAPPNGSSTP